MDASSTSLVLVSALSAIVLTWALSGDWGQARHRQWYAVESCIGLFLMIGMLCATATQVIVRFGLSGYVSLPWTEELARLLLVWGAFWGAIILQRTDDHIAVTVVYSLLSHRAQQAMRLFGDIVTLIFLVVISWYGWRVAFLQHGITMVTLDLPAALFEYSVPACGTLMIVQTIRLMTRRALGKSIPDAPAG